MLEFNPLLEVTLDIPLYCQLYNYVREEIMIGKIPIGEKLPSIRYLSKYLKISRSTVDSAYQQLICEGYVISKPRSGLYVAELESVLNSDTKNKIEIERMIQTNRELNYKYDFDPNAVDLDNFPFSVWRKYTNECLNLNRKELFSYDDSLGERKLREEICIYLRHSRGVYCSPEQIVIGATVQQLTGMVCQLIGLTKLKVAIEDPGCIEMKSIFKNLGYQVVGIPVHNDGIDIDKLEESGAKMVYTTPSKQFPCSVVMSINKRMKLLNWARSVNGIIFEGDYDGEYRYHGKPIPALQGLSNLDNVIYLSTFTKYILPSICMSFMVLPSNLLSIFNKEYCLYEQSVSRMSQQILQQFMKFGHWESHIRKMRTIYNRKHALLLNSINRYMDKTVTIVGRDAGLHILIEIKNGMNEQELIKSAEGLGVKVYSYSDYLWDKKSYNMPKLIIGFGGLSYQSIEEGIQLLSKAWRRTV